MLASAAAVYPLFPPHRRRLGSLAGTQHSHLVPGAQLAAILADGSADSRHAGQGATSNSGAEAGSSASGTSAAGGTLQLRLLGVAEVPGVRQALARLLAAPSMAGPTGWQLGWLLHRRGADAAAQLEQLPADESSQQTQPQPQPARQAPAAKLSMLPAPDMLAVASHIAVLQPITLEGAAALQRLALPWPCGGGSSGSEGAAPWQGQPVTVVGAPFGALAPQHFAGFLSTGIVSAAVASGGGSSTGGSSAPALLLADVRCSPGMEGGPVFSGRPAQLQQVAEAAAGAAGGGCPSVQHPLLLGMLLPPLKAPAVHVEWAVVAPIAAVVAAAQGLLAAGAPASMGSTGSTGSCCDPQPDGATAAAAAAAAAQGVVAVAAGGSWASGVLVSEAGHILTNAHLLQPAGGVPASSSGGSSSPMASSGSGRAALPQRQAHPPVQVLLPGSAGGWGASGGGRWATADVLYVFQGPLDLAVLKLRPTGWQQQQQQQAWRPLQLSRQPPQPGQAVVVAGFPAFCPRGSPLGGTLLTGGALAKVGVNFSWSSPAGGKVAPQQLGMAAAAQCANACGAVP